MGGGSERGLPPADAAPGLPEHPSEEVREESHLPRRIVRTASSPKRRAGGEARHCASADPLDRRIGPAGRPAPTSAQKVELRVSADAQADMPSAGASGAICVQRFDDSLTSCNSHYVSHFAAVFIVARAKTSLAESCFLVQECGGRSAPKGGGRSRATGFVWGCCKECVVMAEAA